MRKWITLLMTCFVGAVSCVNATMGDFNVFAGYRHDSVQWKQKFGHDEGFRHKLHFKDVDMFQIGINARSTIGCNFYARAEVTWAWVLNGDLKRSVSFAGCDCYGAGWTNGKDCKTTFDSKHAYDANIAIGYPFFFCDCTTMVAPVIGYAVDTQNFNLYDRGFGFNSYDEFCSADCCCKHSFRSRWYGPFVGVDFNYRPFHGCWTLYANFEYHWGTFKGRRSFDSADFDECHRHSDMDGWVVNIGADYEIQNNCGCDAPWTVGLYLKFTDFTASRHHHFGWDDDSGYSASSERGKNSADWRSYAVNIEFGKQF